MNKPENFLGNLFRFASETINGAEKSFLDLLSAIVPYFVPIIPAYLTFFHTQNQMDFPLRIAWTAAFVVEVLGITAVSTAIRFWRHNIRYSDPKNKAPFKLAVGVYLFYIVIVIAVNVILEIVAQQRGGWIILSIALFTLLSVPSGVLISIRAQYSEMLEERQARRQPAVQPSQTFQADTSRLGMNNNHRPKITKICECGCGRAFTTTFPNRKTYSAACRKRLSRQKSQSVT